MVVLVINFLSIYQKSNYLEQRLSKQQCMCVRVLGVNSMWKDMNGPSQ